MTPLPAALAAGFEAYLAAWHGEPERPVELPEGHQPEPLRRWWALTAAHGRPLTIQNDLLGADECWEADGLTVFYDENQSVVHWAHEASGDDPQVWERIAGADEEWTPLGLSLSDFLAEVAVFETSFGPHALVRAETDRATLDAVLDGLVELPVTAWPGIRFLAGDRVLASVLDNQPPEAPVTEQTTWTLQVVAPEPEHLDLLAERSPVPWDVDSRR